MLGLCCIYQCICRTLHWTGSNANGILDPNQQSRSLPLHSADSQIIPENSDRGHTHAISITSTYMKHATMPNFHIPNLSSSPPYFPLLHCTRLTHITPHCWRLVVAVAVTLTLYFHRAVLLQPDADDDDDDMDMDMDMDDSDQEDEAPPLPPGPPPPPQHGEVSRCLMSDSSGGRVSAFRFFRAPVVLQYNTTGCMQ